MRAPYARILAVFALAVWPLLLSAGSPAQTSEPQKVTISAHKFAFQPDRIEVKAGQPVEISLVSEDTKHGFSCKGLGVDGVVFDKKHPGTVTFTPAKAGTYPFKCAHFCGLGHSKMKGEIVVTP
jgi:heme/copper-type cytochrome/quinol oxidase subunit 2